MRMKGELHIIVKITNLAMQEFELIKTEAPLELLEETIRIITKKLENGERTDEPYENLKENGYEVELLGTEFGPTYSEMYNPETDEYLYHIDHELYMEDYWDIED